MGRPRAPVACQIGTNRYQNVCPISGLEPSQQPEVNTAERPKLFRRFSPSCPRRSVALACWFINLSTMVPKHLCSQAACTLQMTTNRVRKSDGQQEALKRAREAAAETLMPRHAADASSAAVPVDSGTDLPPAGRFRRSCRAPPPHRCSRTGHCSCPRCSGRRDGDWWKRCLLYAVQVALASELPSSSADA